MKIQIEVDPSIKEPEITIRCQSADGDALKIQTALADALKAKTHLALFKNDNAFFLAPDQVLFFESVDGKTFAHTANSVLQTKLKLYELEEILPSNFVRAGKSVIVGTKYILSVTRNLTGPSLARFRGSHKQINVSRNYRKQLIDKLTERSFK